ncbi:24590_t:CDS:2 [Racocetra persica]|uniref:24590_t:CDS:1 n=1 Tax=Racocetra persica TaxID=160502 RepID=A0ACA9LSA9_9GLOM|nr:24590_t:CDS:2 [Racocetra persica]
MGQSNYKHSFIKAYASEEEEAADINNLQAEFKEQITVLYMNMDMNMNTNMDINVDINVNTNIDINMDMNMDTNMDTNMNMDIDTDNKAAIIIISKKHLLNDSISIYEYQIETNYSLLDEIRYTQVISETVKRNLTYKVKYNQGFSYTKKAVNLALKTGCEDELNKLLQDWIKETKRKIYCDSNESNKQNLPNISNLYLTQTKDASKKRIKSIFEKSISKYCSKDNTCIIMKNLQNSNHE